MLQAAALLLAVLAQDSGLSVSVTTKDGNVVTGTMEAVTFTLESSLGKTEIALRDIASVRWVNALTIVSTNDGTSLKGKTSKESWTVKTKLGEFTVKTADLDQISVLAARPAPQPPVRPAPAAPAPAVAPAAPPTPPKPEAAPGLIPIRTLKLSASIARAIRSADGKKLTLLNTSDSKVLVVNLETFQSEKEIPLPGGETCLSIAPSGAVMVAAGKKTITVVSPAQGKVVKSFTIENDVTDVCAIDDQTLLAGTSNQLLMISLPKQAVVSKCYAGSGNGRLMLSKDSRKLYAGGSAILLPDKAQGREELLPSTDGRGGPQDFVMSPDGRFGVAAYGQVMRLGKTFVGDMLEVTKVETHWASAWSPGAKRLSVATSAGFIKEYSTETWELSRSWMLGWLVTDLFADDQGALLTAIGRAIPAGSTGGDLHRQIQAQPPPGDLVQFQVPK